MKRVRTIANASRQHGGGYSSLSTGDAGAEHRPSLFKDTQALVNLETEDSEFRERKLELWRRAKGAMNRWAQLQRMTKYGLAWLSDTAKLNQQNRAEVK